MWPRAIAVKTENLQLLQRFHHQPMHPQQLRLYHNHHYRDRTERVEGARCSKISAQRQMLLQETTA